MRTHGDWKNPLNRLWHQIKTRCFNPKTKDWPHYGGRGISIYEPWRTDFTAFRDWIEEHLGPKPSRRHSLDRIDNDGDYEPGNLRWATHNVQTRNQRPGSHRGSKNSNAKLSERDAVEIRELWDSGALTQGEIADRFGISRQVVNHVLRGRSWSHARPAA